MRRIRYSAWVERGVDVSSYGTMNILKHPYLSISSMFELLQCLNPAGQ